MTKCVFVLSLVQALLAAGALNAASTVLQACACACVSSTRPCKKQRTDTGG